MTAVVVNLVLITAIVLLAEGRFAELEQRIETLHEWRGELGEEAAVLHDSVTTLRGELATLSREAGSEAELRDGLVSLEERVDRIEVMVRALWGTPTNRARLGVS